MQRQEQRFFHALVSRPNPPAQKLDDLHRKMRLALEISQELIPGQHEQLGFLRGDRIGRARPAVEQRDLAEQVAGAEHVDDQTLAALGAAFDADLPAANAVERVADVALDEQHLAGRELPPLTERRDDFDRIRPQPGEQRVHRKQGGEIERLSGCSLA